MFKSWSQTVFFDKYSIFKSGTILRRPIALRGNTEYLQPHMLGKVVLRYLEGVDDPLVDAIRTLLSESLAPGGKLSDGSVATLQLMRQEVGGSFQDRLCTPVFCTAMSVLWMALHKEKFPLLAVTLQSAAGIAGKQRWALILPTTARVSLVTYTTVIAVRYPELDNYQSGMTCFGNYLLGTQSTHGGFLPVFWDAPICMPPPTLDVWLSGFEAVSPLRQTKMAALQCCITETKW